MATNKYMSPVTGPETSTNNSRISTANMSPLTRPTTTSNTVNSTGLSLNPFRVYNNNASNNYGLNLQSTSNVPTIPSLLLTGTTSSTGTTNTSNPVNTAATQENSIAQQYQSQQQAAKQQYENSLNYLIGNASASNQSILDALQNEYNALVTKLNDNYASDAKSAYVNKMLAGQALDESLANMGVSTQGYGLSQRMANESNYGANLASLQNALGQNLADASANYQSQVAQQKASYLDTLNSIYSSMQSSDPDNFTWAVGTTVSKNSDGTYTYYNPSGETRTVQATVNPYTMTVNSDANNGTFSNGYQPDNIGGNKLKTVTKKTFWMNGNLQNVYSVGKKYYVWDGQNNTYVEVDKKGTDYVLKQ